eukprot:6484643-Amphidinium_carterae.5
MASVEAERGHLATLRHHAYGVKRVIVVSEAAAYAYLRAKQSCGPTPPFTQVWDCFMKLGSSELQQFISLHGKNQLWYGTLRPGDTLFTPAGTLVIEQVTGAKMGLGVKWHTVTHAEKSVLEGIRSHIVSAPRSSTSTLELLAQAIEQSSALGALVALQRSAEEEKGEANKEVEAALAAPPDGKQCNYPVMTQPRWMCNLCLDSRGSVRVTSHWVVLQSE